MRLTYQSCPEMAEDMYLMGNRDCVTCYNCPVTKDGRIGYLHSLIEAKFARQTDFETKKSKDLRLLDLLPFERFIGFRAFIRTDFDDGRLYGVQFKIATNF